MLTCKEATQLASRGLDEKLTVRERVSLWLHLAMCRLCRHYVRNIKKLHAVMQKAGAAGQVLLPDSVRLSRKSRERIEKKLRDALRKADRSSQKIN